MRDVRLRGKDFESIVNKSSGALPGHEIDRNS